MQDKKMTNTSNKNQSPKEIAVAKNDRYQRDSGCEQKSICSPADTSEDNLRKEKMNIKDFRKYVMKEDDNITKAKDLFETKSFKSFKTFCKKCGSGKVEISNAGIHYSEGSEYTGIYGENVDLLIKCIECGNAEEVNLE